MFMAAIRDVYTCICNLNPLTCPPSCQLVFINHLKLEFVTQFTAFNEIFILMKNRHPQNKYDYPVIKNLA